MLDAIPCRLCGYHAPGPDCPHCDLAPREPMVAGPGPGLGGGVAAGLWAVPRGLGLLWRTRGVKRYLVPPFLLTSLAFIALFMWIQGWMVGLLDVAMEKDFDRLGLEEGWLRTAVEWLLARQTVVWLAQAGGWAIAIVTSSLIALWTFSLAYEAIAGPFLDEVHGRFEERWFGANPRDSLQRPTGLPARQCAILSGLASVPALVLAWLWYQGTGAAAWAWLAGVPISFLVASAYNRDYGIWLWWVIRLESETLWVSVKASIVAGLLLIFFLWLKLVPFVGFWLFSAVAGFTTAISLLDIPFSRRQWSMRRRLSFLGQNAAAITAYGAVSGLLFLVPILGPAMMVPAASVGGLWLLVRLDKNRLRPPNVRQGPASTP